MVEWRQIEYIINIDAVNPFRDFLSSWKQKTAGFRILTLQK